MDSALLLNKYKRVGEGGKACLEAVREKEGQECRSKSGDCDGLDMCRGGILDKRMLNIELPDRRIRGRQERNSWM